MYEDTLLEKLNYLLETKSNILQAIKDIGNNTINEYTVFSDYPEEIRRVHADILDVCRYLKMAVDGGTQVPSTEDLSAKDTYPYIQDILKAKVKLAENLMVRGVTAENTEAFIDLAEKVLLIKDAGEAVKEQLLNFGNRLDTINGEIIL